LKTELEHRGAAVVLTRGKDAAVSNAARIAAANSRPDADAFVTLHLGETRGGGDSTTQGVALTIANDRSRPLANALRQSMIDLLKMSDRGVKKTPSLWFRGIRVPAVLLAAGYLTHPEEGPQIAGESRWQDIALAIADGLESYFAGTQSPAQQDSTE
jgi:N-acetylmuramoyl-L-alanine amidase